MFPCLGWRHPFSSKVSCPLPRSRCTQKGKCTERQLGTTASLQMRRLTLCRCRFQNLVNLACSSTWRPRPLPREQVRYWSACGLLGSTLLRPTSGLESTPSSRAFPSLQVSFARVSLQIARGGWCLSSLQVACTRGRAGAHISTTTASFQGVRRVHTPGILPRVLTADCAHKQPS